MSKFFPTNIPHSSTSIRLELLNKKVKTPYGEGEVISLGELAYPTVAVKLSFGVAYTTVADIEMSSDYFEEIKVPIQLVNEKAGFDFFWRQ